MTPSLDLFGTTDHLVEDAKTRCRETGREPGGGGINVARNLHFLGNGVQAIFPAGGSTGDMIETMLGDESVPCRRVPVSHPTRQNLALTETATGRMFHLVFPGAELSEAEWHACESAIRDAGGNTRYLVLSGSLPPGVPENFYARLAEEAAGRSIRVVVDTSGRPLEPLLDSGVYLAKLNRKELAQLGYSGDWGTDSQLSFMAGLVESGVAQLLVVTQGAQGALMATASGERLRVTPPAVEIVSHVGAGDSFVSMMVHSLCRGRSEAEALAWGVAGAAATISTPGNRIPEEAQVHALFARIRR
ncbi:6-phosphofructokinase 2 [Halospina denitrificans]|uniref:Phosphofructokinase n=2 Tax=Halospina denitrificans TaxID=332522 RepID=A0A4R7JU52_9GAMM|nr:6-phosphofructokinase 2 [Halospina denitrificans]